MTKAATPLVQNVADSEKRFQDGRYLGFIDDAGDQGLVELAGDTRPALTPRFPASLRFDVALPEAAFLTLAPALITRPRVGRARVEFVVVVETRMANAPPFSPSFCVTPRRTNGTHEKST